MKEVIKMFAYKIANIFIANSGIQKVVGGIAIKFPVRYSRYYPADYEPELFKFLRENCKEKDIFLDCGAHFGLFSVVASGIVGEKGKVLSFEPMPEIRDVLEEVIRLNDCPNVTIRNEAVSREKGTATFFDTGNEGSNANSLVEQERHHGALTVNTISLDSISEEIGGTINCVKVDVEGAEYDLLLGAGKVLNNDRPSIYLSLHPDAIKNSGASLEQIWDLLADSDYKIYQFGNSVQKEWFSSQGDLFDVVCLPV